MGVRYRWPGSQNGDSGKLNCCDVQRGKECNIKHLLKNLSLYVTAFACLLFSVGLFGQDAAPNAGQSTAGAAQGGAQAARGKSAHQLEVERYEALHPTIPLGSTAPDFSVVDTNGKKHTLAEFKKYPILAIVFTCTHCPYAQMYEDRIQKLYEDYSAKNVGFIAVNPNAALAASPTELAWTDVDDSYQNMSIRQAAPSDVPVLLRWFH